MQIAGSENPRQKRMKAHRKAYIQGQRYNYQIRDILIRPFIIFYFIFPSDFIACRLNLAAANRIVKAYISYTGFPQAFFPAH
jgi:hypothetical protein